jgi:hypothetical protein
MREYEKLKRESEKEANKLRLDTARYQRADQMQRYGEANKIADRMEGRKEKLFTLDMAQKQELAKVQLKEKEMANELTKARIAAGPGYAAANKLDFNTRILQGEITKGMSDWKTKNPGKTPTEADIANINAAAGERAANLTKQYSGQIGQERIDLARQDKIEEAMGKWRDSTTGNRQLRDAAKEDKKAGRKLDDPNSLTYQLEQRKRKEYETIFGAGAAQPAPASAPAPAQTQQAARPTTKEEYDKLPKGAEYIAPDGTRRVKQ